MSDLPDRNAFETMYARQAPWDIGKPQQPFVDVADRISGSVLDAGCGTGDTALFLAARGLQVTGIDFLDEPIRRAKQKASEKGLAVTFLVMDALALADWTERFDNVIDSGLFHVFSDQDRQRYVAALAAVLRPGGRLFLICWSDEEPDTQGPRRVSRQDLHDAFAAGWTIESIQPCTVEMQLTRPDLRSGTTSTGSVRAWFVVVQRTA